MRVGRVALTGGIATGKSYVRAQFDALGVPTIDADTLAREAVAPGSEGLARPVTRFGGGVLLADGSLDRRALGHDDPAELSLRRQAGIYEDEGRGSSGVVLTRHQRQARGRQVDLVELRHRLGRESHPGGPVGIDHQVHLALRRIDVPVGVDHAGCRGEEFAQVVEGTDVNGGIRARGFAERALVNERSEEHTSELQSH